MYRMYLNPDYLESWYNRLPNFSFLGYSSLYFSTQSLPQLFFAVIVIRHRNGGCNAFEVAAAEEIGFMGIKSCIWIKGKF